MECAILRLKRKQKVFLLRSHPFIIFLKLCMYHYTVTSCMCVIFDQLQLPENRRVSHCLNSEQHAQEWSTLQIYLNVFLTFESGQTRIDRHTNGYLRLICWLQLKQRDCWLISTALLFHIQTLAAAGALSCGSSSTTVCLQWEDPSIKCCGPEPPWGDSSFSLTARASGEYTHYPEP